MFENEIKKSTNSNQVVLMLDYIANNPARCFELNYPIQFSSNNENNITYLNNEAIQEALPLFDNNFFINAVLFPFKVTLNENNETIIINNNSELSSLLSECTLSPFIARVLLENTCINYRYPILLNESNNTTTIINSIDEFLTLLPNIDITNAFINYPITTNSGLIINNEFEHLALLNICENNTDPTNPNENECSTENINLLTNNSTTTSYTFTLENLGNITFEDIQWSVNNMIIENQNDLFLNYRIVRNGIYEICAEITPLNCENSLQICTTSVVDDIIEACSPNVELLIDKNESIPGNYVFTAIYTSVDIESVRYTWNVDNLPDGVSIDDPSDTFSFTFTEARDYTICLNINDINCPATSFFLFDCESLTVTPEDLAP